MLRERASAVDGLKQRNPRCSTVAEAWLASDGAREIAIAGKPGSYGFVSSGYSANTLPL